MYTGLYFINQHQSADLLVSWLLTWYSSSILWFCWSWIKSRASHSSWRNAATRNFSCSNAISCWYCTNQIMYKRLHSCQILSNNKHVKEIIKKNLQLHKMVENLCQMCKIFCLASITGGGTRKKRVNLRRHDKNQMKTRRKSLTLQNIFSSRKPQHTARISKEAKCTVPSLWGSRHVDLHLHHHRRTQSSCWAARQQFGPEHKEMEPENKQALRSVLFYFLLSSSRISL